MKEKVVVLSAIAAVSQLRKGTVTLAELRQAAWILVGRHSVMSVLRILPESTERDAVRGLLEQLIETGDVRWIDPGYTYDQLNTMLVACGLPPLRLEGRGRPPLPADLARQQDLPYRIIDVMR